MDFFDIFQLFALAVFLIIFTGRTIQLYFRGKKVFKIGQGKSVSTNLIEISFMLGLIAWIYLVIVNAIHLKSIMLPDFLISPIIQNLYLNILGTILILLGLVIWIAGIFAFGNSWRIGIDTQSRDILITTGIFAHTRNPIFLFMDIYFIGTALISSTPFFILFSLITLFGIHQHIKSEEKFLKSLYGKPYLDYQRKVRRYL